MTWRHYFDSRRKMMCNSVLKILGLSCRVVPSAFLLLAAAPPTREDVDSGLWRIIVDLTAHTANGEPLSSPQTDHQEATACVLSKDGNVGKLLAAKALPKGCSTSQIHASNGSIGFKAVCPPDEDDVSIEMSGDGTYMSTKMSININANAQSDGNRADMSGKLVAVRLGDCPARK